MGASFGGGGSTEGGGVCGRCLAVDVWRLGRRGANCLVCVCAGASRGATAVLRCLSGLHGLIYGSHFAGERLGRWTGANGAVRDVQQSGSGGCAAVWKRFAPGPCVAWNAVVHVQV